MDVEAIYSAEELAGMPTLSAGHCCNLKVDTGGLRVWLCRVGGGVTVEKYADGRWSNVAGGCMRGQDYPIEGT